VKIVSIHCISLFAIFNSYFKACKNLMSHKLCQKVYHDEISRLRLSEKAATVVYSVPNLNKLATIRKQINPPIRPLLNIADTFVGFKE